MNIFDSYGKISINFDEQQDEIDNLSDEHRETLFELIDAASARDKCEIRVLAARTDVREKEAAYNESVHNFNQTTVADVPHAEARRTPKFLNDQDRARTAALKRAAEAFKPSYVASKPKPNKLKSAMDAAELELTQSRAALYTATGELRTLETKAGEAINAWRKCLTTPTREQVAREYMARSQAERAERVAAGLSAEPLKAVSGPSELDRNMASRGKVANRLPKYHGPR